MDERIRVGVDMSIMRHPFAGTARWTTGLVGALAASNGLELVEWLGPRRMRRGGIARKVANLSLERAWFWLGLRVAARRAHVRVLLMPANLTSPRMAIPQVVTIHDLNFLTLPGVHDPTYARYANREFRRSSERAWRITTVSGFSRQQIIYRYGVDPGRIDVVYPGLERHALPRNPPAPVDTPYALYVGASEPHKDIGTAIAAWRSLTDIPLTLAIVGQPGRDHTHVCDLAAKSHGRVIVVGRVTDAELERWYGNASMFVFPSRAEGFGYPPLEAMQRSIPVVSSDAASLPEVLGDAALYFPAGDESSLATRVRSLWEDDPLRRRLAAAGADRASMYTWERAASSMTRILRAAAAAAAGRGAISEGR